jgi:hypothetical protein
LPQNQSNTSARSKKNPTPPQLVSSFSFIDETTITWKENLDALVILNIWAWKGKFFSLFG